jgi:hypothetical protein
VTFYRGTVAVVLFALLIGDVALIVGGVARHPAFFSQPGAALLVVELVSALLAYGIAVMWIAKTRDARWDGTIRSAALFGLLGGTMEALNIAIENGVPAAVHVPALPLVFMLAIFTSWGVAGLQAARSLHSIRAGLLTAVSSAGICMLLGVTAGLGIELLAPPLPAYVATWAEFKRSGWTDAHAFALANTLDSAFTHLIVGPVVALVFGGVASLLAQFSFSKRMST